MFMTNKSTFTLLSIGQRAVGKTVFLAGSYAELHSDQTKNSQQLWFDCQDTQEQESIEHLLNYVVHTGQYPPATMKLTNFNFSLKLKQHSLQDTSTLCHFDWVDIPGESCHLRNPEFQSIAFTSDACCVFIDAYALIHNKAYLQVLENSIKQVMAVANLFYTNSSKYAFALILTKCDLLEPFNREQIEQGLQPLTSRLDAVNANYQTFYSFIPIVPTEAASTLKPKGAAEPLLWLLWELNKAYNSSLTNNLLELVNPLLSNRFQPRQAMVKQALQSKLNPDRMLKVKKTPSFHLQLANFKYILLLALAAVSFLGSVSAVLVKDAVVSYQQENKIKTSNRLRIP